MNKRLGKGMDSLLSNKMLEKAKEAFQAEGILETEKKINKPAETPSVDNTPYLIDTASIITNPNQPRKIFKEKDLEELALSIKENGIIQPLVVAKVENGYELIAGERRLRAAKKLNLEKVPVIIKRVTEKEKMVMSIIENVQRADLNCVEEALAYYRLMNEFQLTQEEVAKRIGKERSSVANFLRILNLPREVIELLQKESLSFGHAKILVGLKEKEQIIRFANQAVENQLSVRELEKATQSKPAAKEKKESIPDYFSEKLQTYKDKIEQRTGFQIEIGTKKPGQGSISLKFNNEAEFNDIYEFIMKK